MQDDANKFISNKGTEFSIVQIPNGHYIIQMNRGGKAPKICENRFTGKTIATKELEKYLKSTDRLGFAQYPSKVKDGKSKNK